MKVCFLYCNLPLYTKNKIVLEALRSADIEVIDCGSSVKNSFLRNSAKFLKFLAKKRQADVILVGFVGHPLVKLVKVFTRKPIVFDAYMSMYNTMVDDKKRFRENSLRAKVSKWLDVSSCRAADIVLLDTCEHIEYFVRGFRIPRKKFRRLFIGALDSIFCRQKPRKEDKVFVVEFHGVFIPLQGIETIIGAARLLSPHKDIKFRLAGSGQTFDDAKRLARGLSNLEFVGPLAPEKIPSFIASSDVGLGIFGTTKKALRVIPNKAFEVIAVGRPLITADTPAAREFFAEGVDVLFSVPGDPVSLSECIRKLKNDKKLQVSLASNGLTKFKNNASSPILGLELKKCFKDLMKK